MKYIVTTDKGNTDDLHYDYNFTDNPEEKVVRILNDLIQRFKEYYAYDEDDIYDIMGLVDKPIEEISKLITPTHLMMIEKVFDLMLTRDDSPGLFELADELFDRGERAVKAEKV